MFQRPLVLLRAGAATLLATCAAAGVTARRECPGPAITADAALHERYPELIERLRSELRLRPNVDACAEVELGVAAASIVVKVALPDGRATRRDVSRREDVLPTLQALLLVPERAAPPAAAPAEAAFPMAEVEMPAPAKGPGSAAAPISTRERGVPLGIATPLTSQREAPQPVVSRPRDHGFELSVVSGVRIGDEQYGYGLGVLSFIEIQRWLIGFHGRADGYRALRGGDPETALALGLLLGRRIDLGSAALDVTAGPALALRGASFSDTAAVSMQGMPSPTPPPVPPREGDVGPAPRLLVGVRLGFSPRSVFRTFLGVDGEFGPRTSAEPSRTFEFSGRMPAYTFGVAFGATVGTR